MDRRFKRILKIYLPLQKGDFLLIIIQKITKISKIALEITLFIVYNIFNTKIIGV